jgi:formylmethanofuran dehydrogenase subunit D
MMRLTRLIKFEARIVVARVSEEIRKATIYLNPEFAKRCGIKEGDVVAVSRGNRGLSFRVKLLETAPEDGGIIPNSIFSNFLADFESFKSFRADIELSEGDESTEEDVIRIIMQRK